MPCRRPQNAGSSTKSRAGGNSRLEQNCPECEKDPDRCALRRHTGGVRKLGVALAPSFSGERRGIVLHGWAEFRRAPLRLRAHVLLITVAAILSATALDSVPANVPAPTLMIAVTLVATAALYVESARWLATTFGYLLQPHPFLAAWSFAAAILLPSWWLLLIVPATVLHVTLRGPAVARGLRWLPVCSELVLCGAIAARCGSALWAVAPPLALPDDAARLLGALVVSGTAFLAAQPAVWLWARALRVHGVRWWVRDRHAVPGGAGLAATVLLKRRSVRRGLVRRTLVRTLRDRGECHHTARDAPAASAQSTCRRGQAHGRE